MWNISNWATFFLRQNKTEEAIESYRKYLEKTPTDERIASVVGLYYYNKKHYKEALPYLEKIKEPKLLTSSVIIKIGDCYFADRQYQKAVEYFAKARTQNPSHAVLQEILKPLPFRMKK